jgi:transposase-like protein
MNEEVSGFGQFRDVGLREIEFRLMMRDKVSKELRDSIDEHGVLVPPIILELTENLKHYFKTNKPYLCLDGHSRLSELPSESQVRCYVVTYDKIVEDLERLVADVGLKADELQPDTVLRSYILRLHACREPLPRERYIEEARRLMSLGLSLRAAAKLLGISKSTLHDWLKQERVRDEDLEPDAAPRSPRVCGFCGEWIHRGAHPIWFHATCLDHAVEALERAKAERGRRTKGGSQHKGGGEG